MGELLVNTLQVAVSPLVFLLWAVSLLAHAVGSLICPKRRRPAPRSILITGATSGIGEALAVEYAGPGVNLALTGRNATALATVKATAEARGATVRTHVGDVTDRDALRTWILEVDEAAPLDLAIANAGVTETTSHTEADLERAARDIFAVNVDGVWNTIFPALVGMRRRGAGQIALVSSIAGYGALTGSAAYSASKAAVRVYGDSLRAQLHREGIAVTVICPGFVQSPMTDASARHTPQPFKVSMRYAVNRIVGGLARDEKQIAFPNIVAVVGYWIAQMPSLVRDVLARNRLIGAIKYMSVKRGGGAATAATSDARPGSGTPATAAAAAAAGEGAASGSGGGVARAPSSRSAKKV